MTAGWLTEAALIGASSISRHQGSRLRVIPTLVHDAYTNVCGGVRSSNHDRNCDRRDAWVELSFGPETDYERAFGWYGRTFNESEMARSSECTEQYAQKVFDWDPHCQRGDFTPTTPMGLNNGRQKVQDAFPRTVRLEHE